MANEDSANNKFSSNLKVPPLKIVLISHQNNTVVNISSSLSDSQFKSSPNDKDDNSNDHIDEELNGTGGGRRNGFDGSDNSDKHHHKKNSKGSLERNDSESGQTSSRTAVFSSSSSSSSSSDRSASTTPSSESESLASNSTIISDQHQPQQQVNGSKSDNKEDSSSTNNRQERISRYGGRVSSNERASNSSTNVGKKLSHDNTELTSDTATPSSKEQHLNANQRITRSSQRAAQQSKTVDSGEPNGDETIAPSENQEKIHESNRKVKRRKGEIQEAEQDSAQNTAQTVTMANIYPADYQLPSQNSFELYRDIRKRPYKKLMKLSHIQPRVPHGFKDYLLNGGPYLLDGNKVGVGLNGLKYESLSSDNNGDRAKSSLDSSSRAPLRMKLSNLHQRLSSYQPSQQRTSSYAIPKVAEAPKNLQTGSPLYELFQDQERARQQMRMQHLKERERSILTAEQEILRAYNRAAIADVRQKLHLSACTYFYYQERYHYLDGKSGSNGNSGSKEVPHSQDNSFLCIEGGEAPVTKVSECNNLSSKDSKDSSTAENALDAAGEGKSTKEEKSPQDSENPTSSNPKELGHQEIKKETNTSGETSIIKMDIAETPAATGDEANSKNGQKETQSAATVTKSDSKDTTSDTVMTSTNTNTSTKSTDSNDNSMSVKDGQHFESDKNDDQKKSSDVDSDHSISESPNDKEDPTKGMSDEDLRIFNKEIFLSQLQEIDDKWDKIKRDMLVRHKNEADSLHAVQSLEWEWKAKEVGACDVRVSLKIEPEFVPRVEVLALDY